MSVSRTPGLWTKTTTLITSVAILRIIGGLLVLLMVAAAACDKNTQPADTPISTSTLISGPTDTHSTKFPSKSKATVSPTMAPTPVEPAARQVLEDTLKDPMARIAERVPGFGGVFLDPSQDIVYIYLQDPSMQERAESVLTEVYGSDFFAGREVRVLEGEYSMAHLNAWYRTLRGVIWQVPGISGTGLDERINRIEIDMQPRRGGREEMEAAIATVDVPREAIVINVGCENIGPLDPGESPGETFLRAVHYSLDMVPQASYGETVRMKLTLRNVSDEPVSFSLGGSPPHDFVVTTLDGEQVWHWKCSRIILALLGNETLEPGEALEFTGEWEQVDNRGEPVPPGTYLVRGILDLELPERLVTPAHELEVLK